MKSEEREYDGKKYQIEYLPFETSNDNLTKYVFPFLGAILSLAKDAGLGKKNGEGKLTIDAGAFVSVIEQLTSLYDGATLNALFKDYLSHIIMPSGAKINVSEDLAGEYDLAIFLLAEVLYMNHKSFFKVGSGLKQGSLAGLIAKMPTPPTDNLQNNEQ